MIVASQLRRHYSWCFWNASFFLLCILLNWNGSQKSNLKVTWREMSKFEVWSLLASRCVTVVMHSIALTANAPLELPELKQQRCWLPVNDHRSSSPDVNALFVSTIMDPNPATATHSLMSTPDGWCRLNLVFARLTTIPHLRKAVDALAVPWIVQDLETSRTTWEVGKECRPTTLLALTNCTKNYLSLVARGTGHVYLTHI